LICCYNSLSSISAWFQFEVLALDSLTPLTHSHQGIKMLLPMSSSAPVSTVAGPSIGVLDFGWIDRFISEDIQFNFGFFWGVESFA
jgi:hypothetical protein